MTAPIKLVISGCCGRMGSRIASLAVQGKTFRLVGAVEAPGHERLGRPFMTGHHQSPVITDDAQGAFRDGEVVIEFTAPAVTVAHAKLSGALRIPMVIGTTGLSDGELKRLRAASRRIPIVFSPNMSLGVNVLFELVRIAAQRLGQAYDIEVVEAHHRHKKDAPSGTAKRLAQVLADARRQPVGAIPVHAVRAGDIIGDHTVILAGPSERLELVHRAHSRDVFAQGALTAARFVIGRKPGWYDMADVLEHGA